jgi:hypothetical protein
MKCYIVTPRLIFTQKAIVLRKKNGSSSLNALPLTRTAGGKKKFKRLFQEQETLINYFPQVLF